MLSIKTRVDVSLDIESLGKKADAPILSIGAVSFRLDRPFEVYSRFYEVVDLADAIKVRKIDPDTLTWWMHQSDEARAAAFGDRGGQSLANVLRDLSVWWPSDEVTVPHAWGNGAVFDVGILEHALDQEGIKAPWDFRRVRDLRTIVDVAEAAGFDPQTVGRVGHHHRADDDAEYQARKIHAAWRHLVGIRLERVGEGPTLPAPDEEDALRHNRARGLAGTAAALARAGKAEGP